MPSTMDTADATEVELLRQYRGGDQEAFARLVARHVDWVYSAARRQLGGDVHLAEDVTQAVFIVLAQRGKRLAENVALGPWLFGVTRYAAANARRAEQRRRRHESRAASMKSEQADNEWNEIAPVLDDLVARLRPAERQAVFLRFYEKKSHAEVGAALGCSAEAARKRLDGALQTLRERLSAH